MISSRRWNTGVQVGHGGPLGSNGRRYTFSHVSHEYLPISTVVVRGLRRIEWFTPNTKATRSAAKIMGELYQDLRVESSMDILVPPEVSE